MYYHSGGMTNDPLGENLADSVGLWCACFDFYRFGALTDNIKALLLLLIASSCPIAKESGKTTKRNRLLPQRIPFLFFYWALHGKNGVFIPPASIQLITYLNK